MSTSYTPTTTLGSENIIVNQIDAVPILIELTSLFEEGEKAGAEVQTLMCICKEYCKILFNWSVRPTKAAIVMWFGLDFINNRGILEEKCCGALKMKLEALYRTQRGDVIKGQLCWELLQKYLW